MNTNGQTDCLDLVSGRLVPLPNYALGEGFGHRAQKFRHPLTCHPEWASYKRWPDDATEKPSIYATGGTVFRFLSNEKWEEMSAAQVLTVSGTIQDHPDPMSLPSDLLFPATFVFKTPTRTANFLQVVGTNSDPAQREPPLQNGAIRQRHQNQFRRQARAFVWPRDGALLLFNTNGMTDAVGLESNQIVSFPTSKMPVPACIGFVDDTESNVIFIQGGWAHRSGQSNLKSGTRLPPPGPWRWSPAGPISWESRW